MLESSALASGRVLVVLVEFVVVSLLIAADWSGSQTAHGGSGQEGGSRCACGGGGSSHDLPEQAGLEHCCCEGSGVVVLLGVESGGGRGLD